MGDIAPPPIIAMAVSSTPMEAGGGPLYGNKKKGTEKWNVVIPSNHFRNQEEADFLV